MTGNELRRKVADIINAWDGATRGSAKHLEILNIYNNHKPLARGYRVQVGDAHCATTTSAAYIKAGIAEYTGTECGVGKYVEIAKKKGIWTVQNLEAARARCEERLPLYEAVADVRVSTAGKSVPAIAREVQRILEKEGILCPQQR